jgi:hypothetical protein
MHFVVAFACLTLPTDFIENGYYDAFHGKGADYTSELVYDFMCDLLEIAVAISCPHCESYSGHQIESAICSKSTMKSHTKSLVYSAPNEHE